MKPSWKKRFKPEIVLDKISEIMTVNEDDSVSYSGFEYMEYKASLYSMLNFQKHITSFENNYLVERALTKTAKSKDLTPENFIEELKLLCNEELQKKEVKFHLLTSISLAPPFPIKQIIIGQSTIRILPNTFAKKYSSRHGLCREAQRRRPVLECSHKGYANVIITTKAKSIHKATSQCLDDLDLLRALWSLFANSSIELHGDRWTPINKIRLGSFHTLHKESGKNIDSDLFWFEPNFVHAKPFKIKNDELGIFQKNTKSLLKDLSKCKYSEKIENALLRYVRALDEPDQNTAFLHIWGALESLTAYKESNKENLPKRCAFLFSDYDYHKQVLEHLREYRNQSVHAGDRSEEAKSYCYQLQFYFRQMIFFYLRNADRFKSLDEANDFLDQPVNIHELKRKRDLIDRVIKFRGGDS